MHRGLSIHTLAVATTLAISTPNTSGPSTTKTLPTLTVTICSMWASASICSCAWAITALASLTSDWALLVPVMVPSSIAPPKPRAPARRAAWAPLVSTRTRGTSPLPLQSNRPFGYPFRSMRISFRIPMASVLSGRFSLPSKEPSKMSRLLMFSLALSCPRPSTLASKVPSKPVSSFSRSVWFVTPKVACSIFRETTVFACFAALVHHLHLHHLSYSRHRLCQPLH